MCGEAYGKVPIARCDDLRLVGPQKNVSGKEKRLRKGKVTMWSAGHMRGLRRGTGPMVRWVQGIVGSDCEGPREGWRRSRRLGRYRRICGVRKMIES